MWAAADVVQRAVSADRERIARVLQTRIPELVHGRAVDDETSVVVAHDGNASAADARLRRHDLDDTDIAILRLVIAGSSNPEIGRQVHLSADAVKDRIGRLMRRFGARRRAELSAQALRLGIN
jgi:DNA-binding NarL/FixJ family response regulator